MCEKKRTLLNIFLRDLEGNYSKKHFRLSMPLPDRATHSAAPGQTGSLSPFPARLYPEVTREGLPEEVAKLLLLCAQPALLLRATPRLLKLHPKC